MGNSNLPSNFDLSNGDSQKWGTNLSEEIVDIRTLDSFHFEDITLLKIDVEGSELDVLKGGVETIKTFRPAIWIEMHQDEVLRKSGFNYSRREVLDFLRKMGYSIKHGKEKDYNFFLVCN
jgi:hypothetical protein